MRKGERVIDGRVLILEERFAGYDADERAKELAARLRGTREFVRVIRRRYDVWVYAL